MDNQQDQNQQRTGYHGPAPKSSAATPADTPQGGAASRRLLSPKRLIYAPLLIVVCAMLLAELVLESELERLTRREFEQQQLSVLDSIIDELHADTVGKVDDWHRLAHDIAAYSGHRVTIINDHGRVLADSELTSAEVARLDNHAARPEVAAALSGTRGVAWRYSNTLKRNLLYTARHLKQQAGPLTLRIAKPQAGIATALNSQRYIFYSIGGVALLLIAVSGLLVTRRVEQLIKRDQRELEQRILERTREISDLNQISTLLNACNSYDELNEVLSASCTRLFTRASGALAIYHPSRDKLRAHAAWGESSTLLNRAFAPAACWGLKKGAAHRYGGAQHQIRCQHLDAAERPGASLCIPLIAQGETLGVLQLYSRRPDALQSYQPAAQTLAENLSLAIANLRLREELRNQAIRDPLTGLFNRRYLQEGLAREINRCQRHGRALMALMIDADHFKRFNDLHGHEAGDRVLRAIGQLLQHSIRKGDIACRFGGEEFVLIVTDSSLAEVVEVAERLRDQAGRLDIRHQGAVLPGVTLSIGIAAYPAHAADAQQLLQAADAALYAAKEQGRNRYCVASAPLAAARAQG